MTISRRGICKSNGALLLAVGMGLYLAWWNLCHESGFAGLYFAADVANPFAGPTGLTLAANCISGFAGIMCANIAASSVCKRARTIDARMIVVVAAVQAATSVGVDLSSWLHNVILLVALQTIASATTFFVLIIALSCLRNTNLLIVVEFLAIALITYGAAECLAHLPDFIAPATFAFHHPARIVVHALILIAAATCCYFAFTTKATDDQLTPLSDTTLDPLAGKRKMPLPLALHLATYSLVFGATHALAAGVASSAYQKMLFGYVGIVGAGVLFFALFHRDSRTGKLWPSVREFIFPLAMLSFILLPFSGKWLALTSIALAECAQDSYFAFVFLATLVVARKLKTSPTAALSRAGYVIAPSLVGGVVCGSLLNAYASYDSQLCCMLIAGAFILLVAGTFWVGDDRRVSLVWGLEKRLTPRKFEDVRTRERCDRAAEQFGLTKRERELLPMLVEGQTASMIAETSFISPNTVRTHITRIHRKTGTHSRHELSKLLDGL